MNKRLTGWLRHLAICLFAVSAGLLGTRVGLQTLLTVQTALVAFAGLVVTIFGIWIAVIFPGMAGNLLAGKPPQETPQLHKYEALVVSLYRSCFSLCASFFVFLILAMYAVDHPLLTMSAVSFSWLAFFSISEALWSAVLAGESAVVGQINDSTRVGLGLRLRRLGKKSAGRS